MLSMRGGMGRSALGDFAVPPQVFRYYITTIKSGNIWDINNSRKYNGFFPFSSEVWALFPQLFVRTNQNTKLMMSPDALLLFKNNYWHIHVVSQVCWPTWCTPYLQGNSDCVTVIRVIPRPREVCPQTSLLLKQTRPAHCQENSLTRISWYYTSGTADRREPCVCQPPCYCQQTRWKPSDRLPA